jgi:zinc transport system substrate-binding protein
MAGSGHSEPWATSDSADPLAARRLVRMDTFCVPANASQTGLLWLDPVVTLMACDELAQRLSAERPTHEQFFRQNAETVKESIKSIVDEFSPALQRLKRRRVLAMSTDFDAFLHRFGVDVTHAIDVRPQNITDDHVRRLREVSVQEHVTLLVVRADAPPAMLDDIAHRTGLTIVALEPYGSSAIAGRTTYQEILRFNLRRLLEALSKTN